MVNINRDTLRKIFLYLLIALIGVGLIVLASAGIIDGSRKFDDAYYYLKRQLFQGVTFGGVGFLLAYFVPINFIKKISPVILVSGLALLGLLFVPSLAPDINGANRWLYFGSISFQPSEFIKLALIIYLSALFSKYLKANNGAIQFTNLISPLLILALVSVLLIGQPDVGTLGVIAFICLTIFFFSNFKLKHLGLLVVLGLCAIIVLSITSPYRLNRLKTFLDPTSDKLSTSYHINQAMLGLGSGGWLGLGYGRSVQKTKFLPEPVGDSIFAVMMEEGGFLSGLLVISLLMSLGFVVILLAIGSGDYFNQLLLYGAGGWLIFQTFIHIGAISGILPLTGVPLPFISYGSSSMIALLTMSGLVYNVATNDTK